MHYLYIYIHHQHISLLIYDYSIFAIIYSLRINIVQPSKWVKSQLKLNRPFNKPTYTWCQPETRGRRLPIEFGPKLSSWVTPQLAGPWVAQEGKTRSQHIGVKLEITRPHPKKSKIHIDDGVTVLRCIDMVSHIEHITIWQTLGHAPRGYRLANLCISQWIHTGCCKFRCILLQWRHLRSIPSYMHCKIDNPLSLLQEHPPKW